MDSSSVIYTKWSWKFSNIWNEYKIIWLDRNSKIKKWKKVNIWFCAHWNSKPTNIIFLNDSTVINDVKDNNSISENKSEKNDNNTWINTSVLENSNTWINESIDDNLDKKIIFDESFSSNWKNKFWNLSRKWWLSNISIINDDTLKVFYPKWSVQPSAKPIWWAWFVKKFDNSYDDLYFSYLLKVDENFDFVKWWKLPWLCWWTCPTWWNNRNKWFSSRFMWRKWGDLEVYAYIPNWDYYWTSLWRWNAKIIPWKTYLLTQRVKLNDIWKNNGTIEYYVDGELYFSKSNIKIRESSKIKIDSFIFATFFGWSNSSWETPVDTYSYFKDFLVTNYKPDFNSLKSKIITTNNNFKNNNTVDNNYYSWTKKIIWYFPERGIYEKKYNISDIPWNKLTHINYAFANIKDWEVVVWDEYAFWINKTEIKKLKEKYPHLKVLISVWGWTWSKNFSEIASTEFWRIKFSKSAKNFIKKYWFDWVDIDWEYPVITWLQKWKVSDKKNFTLLMKELRNQLWNNYLLTSAMSAWSEWIDWIEYDKIDKYVDWVNLMSYDFHWTRENQIWYNSALYNNKDRTKSSNINSAVNKILWKWFPASKLIVWVPFYWYSYLWVKSTNLDSSTTWAGPWEDWTLSYKDISSNYLNKNWYIYSFDNIAKVPYLYNSNKNIYISFDDKKSIWYKADYIKNKWLWWIMAWELSQDNWELLWEINSKFKTVNINSSILNNNNVNNYDSTNDLGKLILEYPKDKWPTKILDINNNWVNDLVSEIDPWNIKNTNWTAKVYYNVFNKNITYTQDFTNINQIDKSGWVLWYPEIYVWNKPWNWNYVDWWSKLPSKLDKLNSLVVKASYKVDHSNNLPINFAMEWWFTKDKFEKSNVDSSWAEFMIMLYHNILNPAGTKVWSVDVRIVVDWKEKIETFDIYRAKIWWDFITFLPKTNYNNVDIEFDILDFTNELKKYLPKINNLYLEDWEFGTEYWSPNTKNAKFNWIINKFEVIWINDITSSNTDYYKSDNSTKNNISSNIKTNKNKVNNNKTQLKIQNLLMEKKVTLEKQKELLWKVKILKRSIITQSYLTTKDKNLVKLLKLLSEVLEDNIRNN